MSSLVNEERTLKRDDVSIEEARERIGSLAKRGWELSHNDGFFWVSGYQRWLEIIFWGEFGVLIGIMTWVSEQVEKEKYSSHVLELEKLWYWTEVIIGPFVVIAVFFLLKQMVGSVINGVTENEVRGSIYMTLGISFTLGLYIRRSLGVFNRFKQKFLKINPNNQG